MAAAAMLARGSAAKVGVGSLPGCCHLETWDAETNARCHAHALQCSSSYVEAEKGWDPAAEGAALEADQQRGGVVVGVISPVLATALAGRCIDSTDK